MQGHFHHRLWFEGHWLEKHHRKAGRTEISPEAHRANGLASVRAHALAKCLPTLTPAPTGRRL